MNDIDPIQRLRTRLREHPELRIMDEGETLSVLPSNQTGFVVRITRSAPGAFTVSFDGWHEEIADPDQALNCFCFGLSDECRLRVKRRGGFAVRWTMEAKRNDAWVPDSTVGLLLSPFWRTSEEVLLQNHAIRWKRPAAEAPVSPERQDL